ncbi:MAG TPA: TrkA C-terminal domain-containing protein, partial [Gemmatimonadaceae bacterium]|nr:TrkA C-terminal domain-containing protein [Gemmatimonadaceae bacterium]
NLRGATGATVLAIRRGNEQIPTPLGREVVAAGDLLAVSGSQDALDVACELFAPHRASRDARQTAEIEMDIEALNRAMLARRR